MRFVWTGSGDTVLLSGTNVAFELQIFSICISFVTIKASYSVSSKHKIRVCFNSATYFSV